MLTFTVTRVLESALPSYGNRNNQKLWSNDSQTTWREDILIAKSHPPKIQHPRKNCPKYVYSTSNSTMLSYVFHVGMGFSKEIADFTPGAKPKAVARRKSPKPQLLRPYTLEDQPSNCLGPGCFSVIITGWGKKHQLHTNIYIYIYIYIYIHW